MELIINEINKTMNEFILYKFIWLWYDRVWNIETNDMWYKNIKQ